MEISPIKTALIKAGRRTNVKQIDFSATMPQRKKSLVTAEEKNFKGNISVALNQWDEAAKSVWLPATGSPQRHLYTFEDLEYFTVLNFI